MPDQRDLIVGLWNALSHRDVEKAKLALHPEVDWQDIINGGRRRGVDDVAAYWLDLFQVIRPVSTPVEFRSLASGDLAVEVHHTIRGASDRLWTEEVVTHVFTFRDGLIIRMYAP
jgi:hypothetical protein